MDTINIINNFDQKILMENILMLNQKKLLDMLIEMFENDTIGLSNKTVHETIDFFNTQKIINWDLFKELINLDSSFYHQYRKTKSLYYLVEKKSINLLKFLIKLDNGIVNWNSKLFNDESNILFSIFKKLYWEEDLIKLILDSKHFSGFEGRDNMYLQTNSNGKSPLYWLVSKCSECIIMEAINIGILGLDWFDYNSNQLIHWACKRSFLNLFYYLLENKVDLHQSNNLFRKPIHLACIKNNYLMVKSLIDHDVNLEDYDRDLKRPIDYAIKYGNFELVKLLLDEEVYTEDNFINDVIEYQDIHTINYLIEDKQSYLTSSSFICVVTKLVFKKLYSQIFSYSKIKINKWIQNYLENSKKMEIPPMC